MSAQPKRQLPSTSEPCALQRMLVDELVADYLQELEESAAESAPIAAEPGTQE